MYPGIELETTGFQFGNIGSLDSPLPEQDSCSTLSSPSSTTSQLPKPPTPKETSPITFSYLGKPTTSTTSSKPKSTKVEKLEVSTLLNLNSNLNPRIDFIIETPRKEPHIAEEIQREEGKVYPRSRESVERSPEEVRLATSPFEPHGGRDTSRQSMCGKCRMAVAGSGVGRGHGGGHGVQLIKRRGLQHSSQG